MELGAFILAVASMISALFVIVKGLSVLLKISNNVIELKEWVRKEMREDSGKSLKDLATSTNNQLVEIRKDVDSISTRVNKIERNTA